jgi:hypothetical protein
MLYDVLTDHIIVKFDRVGVRKIVIKLASLRFNQIRFFGTCCVVKFVSA